MNQQNNTYKVLGLMSGTSLDGLDLCLTEFKENKNTWEYNIIATETQKYTTQWEKNLRSIENKSAVELIELDFHFGKLLGEKSKEFINKLDTEVDLIASHGHTIFHQTENGFTYQLGNGAAVAAASGIKTVADFRSLDVALGGQGAPLVPFGDTFLFHDFEACINLGGIANVSFQDNNERLAMDVCACNMVLNYITTKHFNLEFDKDGLLSRQGNFNSELFNDLNKLDFFTISGPKSLGKEWIFETIIPILEQSQLPTKDLLHTFSKHATCQIANILKANNKTTNLLFTGGGSRNKFFMELLTAEGLHFKLPSVELIDYKEALIFAFLGLHRNLGRINTYKSVTGASKNSCGGNIYLP